MSLRLRPLTGFTLTLLVMLSGMAAAAPSVTPDVLHYQGRFTDEGGTPLVGPVTVRFGLYVSAVGGTELWSETHTDVPLRDGVGSILLGSLVSFPAQAWSSSQRFLEIVVDDEVLTPRLTVASVPFAREADRLDGKDASEFESAGAVASLAESDGDPPNTGTNRMHWDNLAGVPAGFADGTDDGGAGGDHGGLAGLEDDDHPQYALRAELEQSDGDPPNTGADLLHWDNLVGVPDGFADGTDDGSTGSGPVTGENVVDSTLTGADVAAASLRGDHLEAGSVTGDRLALETLTGSHVQDDGLTSADILDNTLTTSDVKNNTLTADDLATGSVGADEVADGSLTEADFEFNVGDITSITVTGGLSGGGSSGDVVLSVGSGEGITVSGSTVSLQEAYRSGSAYSGLFVDQAIPAWQPQTGIATVAGAAFRPATPTGTYTVRATSGYLFVPSANNVGAEDEFTAPVQLPDAAEITELRASYWDETAASMEVALWRARKSTGQATKVASVTTLGETASWQIISDPTITEISIDNAEFVYWLVADFPSTPQGEILRLLGVQVSYTTTRPH